MARLVRATSPPLPLASYQHKGTPTRPPPNTPGGKQLCTLALRRSDKWGCLTSDSKLIMVSRAGAGTPRLSVQLNMRVSHQRHAKSCITRQCQCVGVSVRGPTCVWLNVAHLHGLATAQQQHSNRPSTAQQAHHGSLSMVRRAVADKQHSAVTYSLLARSPLIPTWPRQGSTACRAKGSVARSAKRDGTFQERCTPPVPCQLQCR